MRNQVKQKKIALESFLLKSKQTDIFFINFFSFAVEFYFFAVLFSLVFPVCTYWKTSRVEKSIEHLKTYQSRISRRKLTQKLNFTLSHSQSHTEEKKLLFFFKCGRFF
jgi:hypothetical protein